MIAVINDQKAIFGLTSSDPYIWSYKPNYCYFWPESLEVLELAKHFLCERNDTHLLFQLWWFVQVYEFFECLDYEDLDWEL